MENKFPWRDFLEAVGLQLLLYTVIGLPVCLILAFAIWISGNWR